MDTGPLPGGAAPPRVSCVVTVFNGERFLDEAIASVVGQQACDDWELLLVDDGSTDASPAIARRWAERDRRIRYLEHEGHVNLGASAARNLGVRAARGEFVGFLDCDDIWLPSALAHRLRVLDANPKADALVGRCARWYSWTGDPADSARDHEMIFPPGLPLSTTLEPPLLFRGIYGTPGMRVVPAMCGLLVRRPALEALGGMADEFTGLHDDQVLYAKMSLHLRVVLDGRPTALYRQHPDSMCAVAIGTGAWSPTAPNPAEDRFLAWLSAYVAAHVTDPDVLDVVDMNLRARGAPVAADQSARTWRDRARAAVPYPIRRWVGARRRGSPPPASPSPTVVDAWAAQYLAAWSTRLDGRTVLVGAGEGDVAAAAFLDRLGLAVPGEVVATGDVARADAHVDHMILVSDATMGVPDSWMAPARQVLDGSGLLLALVPGRDGTGRADTVTAADLVTAARRCFPGRVVAVETFGSRASAAVAVAGGPAADVPGVGLDRHEEGVEVLLALSVSS